MGDAAVMEPGELLAEDEQPRGGCFLLMAPIVFLGILIGGYGAVFFMGWQGRAPTGDRVAMTFDLSCPEAADGLIDRVERMGLGTPEYERTDSTLKITAQLPATPEHAESIPQALATRGAFTVKSGDVLVTDHTHIETAALRLDFSATPSVAIQLDKEGSIALQEAMEADPMGSVQLFFDDTQIDVRKNQPVEDGGKLQAQPQDDLLNGVTQLAAAWSLWLDGGPLACEATVRSVDVVAAQP